MLGEENKCGYVHRHNAGEREGERERERREEDTSEMVRVMGGWQEDLIFQ